MTDSSHQTVIQKNRVFLVKSVDVTNTVILDHLVQEEVLSVEQLMAIKTTCTTNSQTVSALLSHLQSRSPEDWSTFLKCLADNGHGHVVDALKAAVTGPPGLPQVSVVRLQQKMADIILQLFDKIPMWTLHSDLCRVPMDQLYVDLILVKDKQHKLGKEEHLQGYKDLFRKSRLRSTIYLCGEPGVGKSTFTQHLCVEWAKIHDQGTELQEQINETLDIYQFVLPLFLRDVKKDQTLCDVMAEEYHLRPREAEELYHHIDNTEEPVLIIADGLDEYSDSTSEEITKLLLRQILPHITLFITSRFSPETFSAETKLRPDTEVALRGFSETGVKEYLLKYFNHNKEKRDALIKEIEKSNELVHLSHSPAMLLMMATLGEENQQLPSTITGFYEEFVAYVFARMEKKLTKMADRAKSTEEILKRYNAQIMALGCLATGSVKTHKLELKFKQEDVDKHISSEDLNIGFIIQKCTFSREIFYIFIHKTVQEYFLSFYLVHSDKSTQKELLLRFFNSRQAFMESAMIRRFVSGLGGRRIHEQLEELIDGEEWEVAVMHTDLQLEYLAEHQDATLTLPRGVWLYITDRYPASHYVRYLRQDGGEVREMGVVGDVRHCRLLQHLHAPQLTWLGLVGWSESTCSVDKQYITQTLDRTLTKFTLKQLTVNELDDDNEMSAVVRAVVHKQTLQDLLFNRTPLTDDRIQTLTEWLPGCHLTSLEMSDCKLTLQEMIAALSVLPPSLQTLNVSGNDLTGLTDTGQLSGVTRSQIQTLDMSQCNVASRCVLAVIDAAPETLTDLNVSGNKLTDLTDTGQLSGVTRSQIRTLNMSDCGLASRGVLAVIDAAPETLIDLNVSGNNLTGLTDTGQLSGVTRSQIQTLGMSRCHLTSRGVLAVIDAAPETLIDLNVSYNNLTGLTDTGQLSGVTRSPIQTLGMSRCHLASRGVLAVIDAAPETLTHLDVSGNKLTDLTDTGQLSGVIRSQIQTLYMSGCRLTSRGVLAVIDAAPETLTDLDVSGNCLEGGGDDLVKVTERTAQINKLKTLDLQENNMSDDVVRTIKQKLTETCPHLKLKIGKASAFHPRLSTCILL